MPEIARRKPQVAGKSHKRTSGPPCWAGSSVLDSAGANWLRRFSDELIIHTKRGFSRHARLKLQLTEEVKSGKLVFACQIVARCGVVHALVARVVWRTSLAIGDLGLKS